MPASKTSFTCVPEFFICSASCNEDWKENRMSSQRQWRISECFKLSFISDLCLRLCLIMRKLDNSQTSTGHKKNTTPLLPSVFWFPCFTENSQGKQGRLAFFYSFYFIKSRNNSRCEAQAAKEIKDNLVVGFSNSDFTI